jgi:molecular chaperone Hsp33
MTTPVDQLHRFIFDNTDIRGEIVTLRHTLKDIFDVQHYPEPIAQLLGEFLAAAALLSSTLKFAGTLTLQARGDGDLPVIMASVSHQKKLRGVAQINDAVESQQLENRHLRSLLGNGMLSIIIDPEKGERYQGIVALDGDNLAQCLEGYFMQSEQLPTKVWLSSTSDTASGMLLQRLPTQVASESDNEDAWETQAHLASTTSTDELLNLPHLTLLNRLFHESDIRVFEPEPISFACTCSKERSSQTLKRLPKGELDAILTEEGKIVVDCHFCGFQYIYLKDDIEHLFAPQTRH